jgi:hypothetical protein
MKAVDQAFDNAWATIAKKYADDANASEAGSSWRSVL